MKFIHKYHQGWSRTCDECNSLRPIIRIEFHNTAMVALHLCRHCLNALKEGLPWPTS